jgi:hypothetical protein
MNMTAVDANVSEKLESRNGRKKQRGQKGTPINVIANEDYIENNIYY